MVKRVGVGSCDQTIDSLRCEFNTGHDSLDDEETFTAYHEAGHAVVAFALGATIESVQLGGEVDEWLPERFGECRIRWGRVVPDSDWQRQREISAILAGPVAELIYRGETPDSAGLQSWQHDWQMAWNIGKEIAQDPHNRTFILQQTVAWLKNRLSADQSWAAVAAVADEILAHEYVEGEKLEEVLSFWI